MVAETVIDAPLLDIYVLFFYIISSGAIVWEWFWRFRFDIFLYIFLFISGRTTQNECVYIRIVSIVVFVAFIQSVDRYVELLKAMWDDIEKWDAVHKQYARTRLVARYRHISTEHAGIVGIHDSGWIE